jgi:hypothetical protein
VSTRKIVIEQRRKCLVPGQITVAFVVWMAAVLGGTFAMMRYANSPGAATTAPAQWPADSSLERDTKHPTLIMFLHPRCPCSRASLGELDVLLAQCSGRFSAYIVFLKAEGTATNWEKSDLWRTASHMAGVTVRTDEGGTEARRFHAETSGQTVLYDPNGALQFEGGITLARGHSGDNAGRSALEDILLSGHAAQSRTPVFGCDLFDKQCNAGETACKP